MYMAIRDDATTQSLVERDFIVQQTAAATATTTQSCLRVDGRPRMERRPVSLSLSRSDNLATATVTLGAATRATCTVTAELVAPSTLDRPNEGSIQFTVDLSPAASTSFRQATPAATGGGGTSYATGPQLPNADRHQKLTANHILRCLERCLLQGGALDTEALCVIPGAYVWKLSCCCTILDQGGNLTDAAVLACLAAVRHYRKPIVEMSSGDAAGVPQLVPSHLKEPTPLPLHHTPLTISFALYDHAVSGAGSVAARLESATPDHASGSTFLGVLIDPTAREELCQTGSLVLALNVHAEICLVDFSGGCELSLVDLRACHAIAAAHIGPLCQSLETALAQADEKALTERLALLQKVPLPLPPLPPDGLEEPQLLVQLPASTVPTNPTADYERAAKDAALAAEEEAYRRQALDYNLGHVATKVRENKDSSRSATTTSSLLKAMLQSVQGDAPLETTPHAEPTEPPPRPLVPDKPPGKDDIDRDDGASKSATPIASPSSKAGSNMAIDSDEEESTMQLQSEFDTLPVDAMSQAVNASMNTDIDDDADDLVAAVKSKKKSKKKR
jgi:exosome complex component RRP45